MTPTLDALIKAEDDLLFRTQHTALTALTWLRKYHPFFADLVIRESYRLSLEDAKEHEEVESEREWSRK